MNLNLNSNIDFYYCFHCSPHEAHQVPPAWDHPVPMVVPLVPMVVPPCVDLLQAQTPALRHPDPSGKGHQVSNIAFICMKLVTNSVIPQRAYPER